jgi:hypothetical protein
LNKSKAESLVLFVYDMRGQTSKSHDRYVGGLQVLRHIAKNDPTLQKMLKSEGLVN